MKEYGSNDFHHGHRAACGMAEDNKNITEILIVLDSPHCHEMLGM